MIDESLHEISSGRNVMNQLATRGGKSYPICYFAELGYNKNRPVLILAHTDILIGQISADLVDHGIPHGIIKSGHYETRDIIQVASRNTIINRLNKFSEDYFKLIIVDEAHLVKSGTYMKIIEHFKKSKLSLYTATPVRLDGSGFDDLCQAIVQGPTKLELIKKGFILPSFVATPESTMLTGMKSVGGDYTRSSSEKSLTGRFMHGEYVQHYFEFANNKKGLVYCPTVNFAKEVEEKFTANGVPCVEISGRDSKKVRDQKLFDYYDGKYKLMASVDLFTMGFHVREGEVTIVMRPTQSTMVYYQMLGRCTMPSPETGKTEHTVIDVVNNIYTHGHPDIEPEWSLQGETKEQRIMRQAFIAERMVRCDGCRWSYDINAVIPKENGDIACPRCGALREIAGKQMKMIEGNLQLVSVEDWYKYELEMKWRVEQEWLADQAEQREKAEKRLEVRNASTREALMEIAKKRGYSQKWVEYRLAGKAQAREKYSNKGNSNPAAVKPAAGNVPMF